MLSEQEAIQLYRKTGKHLGVFKSTEEATAFAKNLSSQQSKIYSSPKSTRSAAPSQTPSPSRTPAPYSSPDDVRAALRAGKIDRSSAVQILRTQFNYK
jgi:hypothetical protein